MIQIPTNPESQFQMAQMQSMGAPAPTGEEAKHGTGDNNKLESHAGALGESHAQHNSRGHHNDGHNDSDDNYSDDPKSRTSASSRVNFSKLTAEEKERRCHNMSKEVKQLRRKIRNMEERLARTSNDAEGSGSRDYSSGVGEASIQSAKDKIKSFKGFELSDQKDLIDNLCSALAQERMKPDSLAYYMLCTIVRGFLTDEEWAQKYAAKEEPDADKDSGDMFKNKEIVVTLPGKDVRISKKEYQVFAPFQDNEKIMRLLTGQLGSTEIPEASAPQPSDQNSQADMLAKLLQGNSNFQNLNALAEMQNLMNNQFLQGINTNQQTSAQTSASNMMASMMGMGNQNNGVPQMQQDQNQRMSVPQNLQNDQLLNNLMNSNLPWNLGQMGGMNGNFQ
eukprot:CAMPEP_0197006936 /NCGR_PEP_ID=MMETSP1380-20130617/38043_1 /TAXON_ID=5936 /ORGANISM="Euplotes crassus, Strain CT5" /LENGTH=391 /DNA_ID=CAMNT_0042426795 /DNA_START=132 /DNA_END=1307 /DNA_ORIENTATION=-